MDSDGCLFHLKVAFVLGGMMILLMAEIRRSPVEVGSWNPIIHQVLCIPGGCLGFRPATVYNIPRTQLMSHGVSMYICRRRIHWNGTFAYVNGWMFAGSPVFYGKGVIII